MEHQISSRSARVVAGLAMLAAVVVATACEPIPPATPTRICSGIRAYTWCHPVRGDGSPAYGTYGGAGGMIYGDYLQGTACLFSNLGYGCVAEARGSSGAYFEALGAANNVLPIAYWYPGPAGGPEVTNVHVYAR